MSKLDTKIINEKLQEVFNKLDSAAKKNIALEILLRNVATGEYRYYYSHEKNYFVRKIAFTVYESGFDFNSVKR